jgi:hypothetical protein
MERPGRSVAGERAIGSDSTDDRTKISAQGAPERAPSIRARRSKTPSDSHQAIGAAVKFLSKLERQVLRQIRRTCGTLTKAARGWSSIELTYIADLAHVVAHWHDNRAYVIPRTCRDHYQPFKVRLEQEMLD